MPTRTTTAPATAVKVDLTEPTMSSTVTKPLPLIEAALAQLVERLDVPENLREAIGYALLAPGKRIRPLLVWHSAAAVGADPTCSLPACCAIEMIHAFSLVHDDLPGLDDDDLRRGRPTLHRHTSEAMAILAGDAMLTRALGMLSEIDGPATLRTSLSNDLGDATMRMIAGQVYDTLGGFDPSLDDRAKLEAVHHNKTGALIRAACLMGGRIGLHKIGADDAATARAIDALSRYGDAIGLMFQAVDDLLDVTQSTAQLGKRSGKDAEAGKLTYPGLLGIDGTRREIESLRSQAIEAAASFGARAEPLDALVSYLAVRTR